MKNLSIAIIQALIESFIIGSVAQISTVLMPEVGNILIILGWIISGLAGVKNGLKYLQQ